MMNRNRFVFGVAAASILSGCQMGPTAIRLQRPDYNEAIEVTGRQQVLLNIIRASLNEPLQFVDVTTVTNEVQGTAGISGGAMLPQMLGSTPSSSRYYSGHDYSLGFTAGVTDQPIMTYTPLAGQALVNQISQPITVDSVAALLTSNWPTTPVLSFVLAQISTDPSWSATLIDDISILQDAHVLSITAIKSVATVASSPPTNDSLAIYQFFDHADPRMPVRGKSLSDAWDELEAKFADTFVDPGTIGLQPPPNLKPMFYPLPDCPRSPKSYAIELRTVPSSQPYLPPAQIIPTLKTHSALGVLKNATKYRCPFITILDEKDHDRIWCEQDDEKPYITIPLCDPLASRYIYSETVSIRSTKPNVTLEARLPDTRPSTAPATDQMRKAVEYQAFLPLSFPRTNLDTFPIAQNKNPGIPEIRCFIGIVKSTLPPVSSYVSVYHDGLWYHIDKCDRISQVNFELIGQLLAMQSVAASASGPTPTITVGGH